MTTIMLKAAVGAILLLFVCACNAEQQAADPTEVRSDADEIQMLEQDITTAEEGSGTTELATTNLHSPQTLSTEAFELADDGSDESVRVGDLKEPQVSLNQLKSAGLIDANLDCDGADSIFAECNHPMMHGIGLDSRIRDTVDALQPYGSEGEVFNGVPALSLAEWPHTVVLVSSSRKRRPICTGNLVGPTAVLTARHCVGNGNAVDINSYVIFGKSFRKGEFSRVRRVADIAYPLNATSGLDLALLRLSEPVDIEPVRLASDADLDDARAGRVVGFGYRREFDSGNPVLKFGDKMFTDVVIASRDCRGFLSADGQSIPDATQYGCHPGMHIVAGAVKPVASYDSDTCDGDSGGPLFVPVAGTHYTVEGYFGAVAYDSADFRLAGVTSSAVETPNVPAGSLGCGNGGKYVRLSSDIRESIADIQRGWLQD
ncbi:S1 family peptidase [Hyphomonas sp.]|uniref:S1 family peptidase n=1 Tax=Hyphomonas sp. TaxID=87 RepID=UPI003D2AF0B4